MPKFVIGDKGRIGQILVNLIGNAFKFTDHGAVTLKADLTSSEDLAASTSVMVTFSVSDTGIGISEQAQAKLFQPFSQADTSTSRRFGGTGLGLSIVAQMVQKMGGEFGLRSQLGVGSSFWVTVPFGVTKASMVIDNTTSIEVFVVEDDDVERTRLCEIVTALGWSCVAFNDGPELVAEYIRRHNDGLKFPDVLIVDWKLPSLDGLSALSQIVDQLGIEKLAAALMVTAYEQEAVQKLDSESIVDKVIGKPVDGSALFNAVNEIVSARTGQLQRVLELTKTGLLDAQWLFGVKVLVVDDSALNLEVAEHMLRSNGAEVVAVDGAEKSLDILRARSEFFDVVLMDVQMPGMNGHEATRYIRDELGLTKLPVIALTAGALVEEREAALRAGMNDFLTKPIDPDQLVQRVRLIVERERKASLQVSPKAADGTIHIKSPVLAEAEEVNVSQSPQSSLDDENLALWDKEAALVLVGGREDLVDRLVHLYLGQVRNLYDQLSLARKKEDDKEAGRILHTIQGSSSQIAALRVAHLGKVLEAAVLKDGIKALDSEISELEDVIGRTVDVLDRSSKADTDSTNTL